MRRLARRAALIRFYRVQGLTFGEIRETIWGVFSTKRPRFILRRAERLGL